MSDALKKLEAAKKIRDDAEKKAKEIEKGVIDELKQERRDYAAKIAEIDKELERITGKAVSGASGTGKAPRLRGEKKDAFVPVLVAAITKKMSRGDIEALPAVVEHLKAAGFDKVPNLTPILAEQVKAHKLATEGKKAGMKYGPA
jgi:hypothetical protein